MLKTCNFGEPIRKYVILNQAGITKFLPKENGLSQLEKVNFSLLRNPNWFLFFSFGMLLIVKATSNGKENSTSSSSR